MVEQFRGYCPDKIRYKDRMTDRSTDKWTEGIQYISPLMEGGWEENIKISWEYKIFSSKCIHVLYKIYQMCYSSKKVWRYK